MTTTDVLTPPPPPSGEIVARAGTYYRVTRYVITVVMVGMGLWFGYDGFFNWPEQNAKIAVIEEQRKEARARGDEALDKKLLEEQNDIGKHHTDWDIMLQKILFFTLPPLGLALLARWVFISRGAYRLTADNMLYAPGHPPVSFDNVTELDKRLWDRKGIAYVGYEIAGGKQGRIKLDDFVYDREPTDAIFKRVEEYVTPAAAVAVGDTPADSPDT